MLKASERRNILKDIKPLIKNLKIKMTIKEIAEIMEELKAIVVFNDCNDEKAIISSLTVLIKEPRTNICPRCGIYKARQKNENCVWVGYPHMCWEEGGGGEIFFFPFILFFLFFLENNMLFL